MRSSHPWGRTLAGLAFGRNLELSRRQRDSPRGLADCQLQPRRLRPAHGGRACLNTDEPAAEPERNKFAPPFVAATPRNLLHPPSRLSLSPPWWLPAIPGPHPPARGGRGVTGATPPICPGWCGAQRRLVLRGLLHPHTPPVGVAPVTGIPAGRRRARRAPRRMGRPGERSMTAWLSRRPRLLWTIAAALVGLNGAALTGYFPPPTGNPVLAYIEDIDALAYAALRAWLWAAPALAGAALGASLPDLAALMGRILAHVSARLHTGGDTATARARAHAHRPRAAHVARGRPDGRMGRLLPTVARAWHQPGPRHDGGTRPARLCRPSRVVSRGARSSSAAGPWR